MILVKRTAEEALSRLAGQFPIIAILGPRQSGKTTLAKDAFPNKQYLTFDDKPVRDIAQANPQDFIEALPNGAILDEVQKVPEIFDAIKLIIDRGEYTSGKFILTGSSQFRIRENISDSLAGRIGIITLLPFSIEELAQDNNLVNDPYSYVFQGFYPPLYDKNKHFLRDDWFENYIATYIDLDIKDQINPSNVNAFHKLLQLCATMSGQMVNYETLSKSIGVSSVTVKAWLSILEASYIIHFLQPDSNNLGKTIVKTPKLYFVDSGLMCYLLRLQSKQDLMLSTSKGAAVETMAVSELLKKKFNQGRRANLTFFRDKNGFEVDIIADWNRTFAIEVKSNSGSEKALSANVRKYLALRNDDSSGKIFYLGDLTCKINGIEYVSWLDWWRQE